MASDDRLKRSPDLLETRRVAVLLDEFLQIVENLALAFGQWLHGTVPPKWWRNSEGLYAKKRRKSSRPTLVHYETAVRLPPPQAAPFDVVGTGESSLDFLATIVDWPQPDSKAELSGFDDRARRADGDGDGRLCEIGLAREIRRRDWG